MSVEDHPNLHAVGLLTDVTLALENRLRGNACCVDHATVYKITAPVILRFIEELEELLDQTYGVPGTLGPVLVDEDQS